MNEVWEVCCVVGEEVFGVCGCGWIVGWVGGLVLVVRESYGFFWI